MSFEHWINNTHKKNLAFASDKRKARWFCVIAILILATLFFWLKPSDPLLIYISGGYLLLSIILPILLLPLLYPWMWIGSIIGELVGTIFLGTVYYLILFPVSFVVKKKAYTPGWKSKNTYSPKDKLY